MVNDDSFNSFFSKAIHSTSAKWKKTIFFQPHIRAISFLCHSHLFLFIRTQNVFDLIIFQISNAKMDIEIFSGF
jgi:hypothetical protein